MLKQQKQKLPGETIRELALLELRLQMETKIIVHVIIFSCVTI